MEEGTWSKNKLTGYGRISTDINSFIGYFKNDLRHGIGKYVYYETNNCHHGLFYESEENGLGVRYNNNYVYQGLWCNMYKYGPGYRITYDGMPHRYTFEIWVSDDLADFETFSTSRMFQCEIPIEEVGNLPSISELYYNSNNSKHVKDTSSQFDTADEDCECVKIIKEQMNNFFTNHNHSYPRIENNENGEVLVELSNDLEPIFDMLHVPNLLIHNR